MTTQLQHLRAVPDLDGPAEKVTVRRSPGAGGHGAVADLDPLGAYLREIGRTPLLTAEEEVTLSKAIEAGLFAQERLDARVDDDLTLRRELREVARLGDAAKRRMIEANLRLVVSVARKHTARGLPLLDLIQEGNLGLVHAVEKFDYAKGYKFSTYAIWWIKQAIGRGLTSHARTIRVPDGVAQQLVRLHRARAHIAQEHGRPATDHELARELGVTEARVRELRTIGLDTVSLHLKLGAEESTELADVLVDDSMPDVAEVVAATLLPQTVTALLGRLGPREATVLTLRYGLRDGQPHTPAEIATGLGVSRRRIAQMETKALAKLRALPDASSLVQYLQ